ncbi:hypothetical protein PM082_024412 [Marasmius tenuissimus]|nr:hypothetical protein PM082_024412 [Marasmius tenuissimus]
MKNTMDTAEGQYIALFGRNIMLDIIIVITSALLYGIYTILFYASVTILCHREGNRKARNILLAAITFTFAISSFEFWTDAVVTLTGMKDIFVDNIGASLLQKHAAFEGKFTLITLVQEVFSLFEIVIGDSIVFWRVWVLCAGDRRLVLAPLLFLLGTTVCSLGFLECLAQNSWPALNPPTCNALVISTYSLSLATNIVGTVMIGIQVWLYKRNVKVYLTTFKKGQVEKILVLLLESGIVYSLVWVVQLVIVHLPPAQKLSGKIAQQILKAATIQLVGIYPTALIVLIYLQCSMWDSSGNSILIEIPGPVFNVSRDPMEGGSQSTIFEKNQV